MLEVSPSGGLRPLRYSQKVPSKVVEVVRDGANPKNWIVTLEYESTRRVIINHLCRVNVREGTTIMEGTLIGYYRSEILGG